MILLCHEHSTRDSVVPARVLCHSRYGSTFAVQPVLIRDSQNDWLNEQDWRMEAMMRDLKGILLFDESEEECRDGQPDRQSKDCHSIKERDPSLVGKEWASLTAVNLDLLGVSTYDELFPKQVSLSTALHRAVTAADYAERLFFYVPCGSLAGLHLNVSCLCLVSYKLGTCTAPELLKKDGYRVSKDFIIKRFVRRLSWPRLVGIYMLMRSHAPSCLSLVTGCTNPSTSETISMTWIVPMTLMAIS